MIYIVRGLQWNSMMRIGPGGNDVTGGMYFPPSTDYPTSPRPPRITARRQRGGVSIVRLWFGRTLMYEQAVFTAEINRRYLQPILTVDHTHH